MDTYAVIFSFIYQYADNVAFLLLSAVGLVIIFGMMGVINMAHGELMMIGAYVTASSYHAGIPAPIAIIFAGIGAGLAGIVLERLIIRFFYRKLLSSLVVTWGISLVLTEGWLLVFGPSILNVPTPFGSFYIGESGFGIYRAVLFVVSLALIGGVWVLFSFTGIGVRARATMENPEMAEAFGINTSRMYALTFGLGSAFAGLAGGMFALTASISPFFGVNYTLLAFITVVVGGGANVISGIVTSAAALAGAQTVMNNVWSVYVGYVSMMLAAFLFLLILPRGISDYLERRKLRVKRRNES